MPQRPSAAIDVYINGTLYADAQLVTTTESVGADRLDIATLEIPDAVLEDFEVSDWLNIEVEVVRNQTGAVWHWGKVSIVPIMLSSGGGEVLTLVSRTELFHLGGQVDGYLVYDPVAAAPVSIDGDLIFNPMIDGKIYGNLNDTFPSDAGGPLFLDPESVRTAAALALQGADVLEWSLAGAVYYLTWGLNPDETNISNLSLVDLQAIFDDPAALVQDVRIPRGMFLGQALDLLLVPLGYMWYVKRTAIGAREFHFFKRGTGGTLVRVSHQRAGSALSNPRDISETEVDTAGITFDAARLANEITIRGGFVEYEITAELARGWPTADDPAAGVADDLAKDHPDFDDVRDVLRRWVLNEAGDYIGLRAEIDGQFTSTLRTTLTGLSLLGDFIARRRKLLPTLTQAPDLTPIGTTQGVEVEYSNTDPEEWKPIGNWGCHILEHEAGVYFDADRLPEEFLIDPDELKIRATFTLQSDFRMGGEAPRQGSSPNDDVVPLVLDLPDRFRLRKRESALSKYGGGVLPSLAVDDLTAAQDFAEFTRDVWDLMDVSGSIQIEGLDNAYIIGDRVEKIDLKNVSFLARTGSSAYPQIIAIERNVPAQTTTLHLQRFRDPIPLPLVQRGTTQRFGTRSSGGRDTI